MLKKIRPSIIPLLFISLFLSGCNNDSKEKTLLSKEKIQKYSKNTQLSGKVSNKKRSITEGTITATDRNKKVITSIDLKNTSQYSLEIPSGTELPVVLTYLNNKKTDKSKLVSVVIYATLKEYDINELTTLIAKNAKALGGYTHRNLSLAADSTVGVPDANKTSTGFRGDPTKQYGGWH